MKHISLIIIFLFFAYSMSASDKNNIITLNQKNLIKKELNILKYSLYGVSGYLSVKSLLNMIILPCSFTNEIRTTLEDHDILYKTRINALRFAFKNAIIASIFYTTGNITNILTKQDD